MATLEEKIDDLSIDIERNKLKIDTMESRSRFIHTFVLDLRAIVYTLIDHLGLSFSFIEKHDRAVAIAGKKSEGQVKKTMNNTCATCKHWTIRWVDMFNNTLKYNTTVSGDQIGACDMTGNIQLSIDDSCCKWESVL